MLFCSSHQAIIKLSGNCKIAFFQKRYIDREIKLNFGDSTTVATVVEKDIPIDFNLKKSDLELVEKDLRSARKIYLFTYLSALTDPDKLMENYLFSLGFKEKSITDFPGVDFIYYYVLITIL